MNEQAIDALMACDEVSARQELDLLRAQAHQNLAQWQLLCNRLVTVLEKMAEPIPMATLSATGPVAQAGSSGAY